MNTFLTLAVCFLLYLPLAVVCCIAGFIVSRLQLRGNASGWGKSKGNAWQEAEARQAA